MNPKINKIIDEIERTKARIAELQALLPTLERKRVEMEDAEIIRLVRSASISPADLPEFIEALKTINALPEPAGAHIPTPEAPAEGETASIFKEDDTDV